MGPAGPAPRCIFNNMTTTMLRPNLLAQFKECFHTVAKVPEACLTVTKLRRSKRLAGEWKRMVTAGLRICLNITHSVPTMASQIGDPLSCPCNVRRWRQFKLSMFNQATYKWSFPAATARAPSFNLCRGRIPVPRHCFSFSFTPRIFGPSIAHASHDP